MKDWNEKFNRIFEEHYDRVFNICLRMCHNYHTAQDLTQDIFMKIHKNAGDFKGKSKLSTWIYSVSVNRCIDYLRREKSLLSKIARFFTFKNEPAHKVEDQVIYKEMGIKVLKGLSPKNRALLILKMYMNLNYSEIADIMHTTPQSVGVQLSRARKMAVSIAEKEGISI